MPNQHVLQRLIGIQSALTAIHTASASLSNNSKGREREGFIDQFLSSVLPYQYRFGTGDITDANGNRSGQIDVVIEHSVAPTLPSIGSSNPTRLYLAEAVAAAIEVKSNVQSQWGQATRTANLLAPLERVFEAQMIMGSPPPQYIPLFVVGYTGWSDTATLQEKLQKEKNVAGILVIESGAFVSRPEFGGIVANGPWGLWGLISCLHNITNSLQAASTNPLIYAIDPTRK